MLALATPGITPAQSCWTWSAPDTIRTASGHMVYVEHPDVLISRDALTLFGGPSFAFNERLQGIADSSDGTLRGAYAGVRIPRLPNALASHDARMVPLPPDRREWNAPRVVATGDRRGLAWFASPDATGAPVMWRAPWADGRFGKAAPDSDRDVLSWAEGEVSVVHRDGERAFIAARSHLRSSLLTVGDRAGITTTPMPPVAYWPAGTFVADSGDALLLAFVVLNQAADTVAVLRGHPEHLARQVVATLPRGLVQGLLVARASSRVFVVWSEGRRFDADRLRVASSSDSGRTWAREPTLALQGSTVRWSIAADAGGRLHVVTAPKEADHLLHYTLGADAWSGPQPIGPNTMNNPALFLLGAELHALWGAPMHLQDQPFAATVHAVARTTCVR